VSSGVGGSPNDVRVVARDGNRLTFAWTPPAAGVVPTSYELRGGVGTQVLASVPTGGGATQITLAVPDGTFFVRVVAAAGSARSLPSSDITVAVGTGGVPASPIGLLGSASNSALQLSWTNPLSGPLPTGALLQVSGSVTATIPLGASENFSFASVPPGTYTFRVASVAGGGVSPPSPPVTLTFPGTCTGAPNPPTAFSASTQGRVAYLDWLPPAAGEAVTGYVMSVTGAYVGSFQVATRTLAVPVPPGRYTITVSAQGLCGTSAPTPAQTVVVSGAVP
jgi:hypothetical protein